ncbi:unnamed protein product [marine sediment metagenome]|uniref:Uncharacterized protein n=1 Tax=marine sediment metagenome TaxID=412755 RepID=X1PDR2_9ZZZZ
MLIFDLAKAYEAPIKEVLEQAGWPQLLLMGIDEELMQEAKRYLKNSL